MNIGFINKKSFLFLVFVLLLVCFSEFVAFLRTDLSGDLAEYLQNPLRILNGQLPYRDFWLLFPPGEVYFPALIYRLFGISISNMLIFLFLTKTAISLLVFYLSYKMYKNKFLSVFLTGIQFALGTSTVFFLFLLLSAVFLEKFVRTKKISFIIYSSIFCFLGFLFRFYLTGAFTASVVVSLFLMRKKYGTAPVVIFSGLIVIFLALTALISLPFLERMVDSVILSSVTHGTSMPLPYFESAFSSLKHAKLIKIDSASLYFFASSVIKILVSYIETAVNFILYLLPFFFLFLAQRLIFGKNPQAKQDNKLLLFVFIFWAFFSLPKALGRADLEHLAYVYSPLFFLLSPQIYSKPEKKFVYFLIFILFFSAFVLIFKNLQNIKTKKYLVKTNAGSVWFADEGAKNDFENAYQYIVKNTNTGDRLFATTWFSPPFYLLTARSNPTYYDSIVELYAAYSADKEKNLCNEISKSKIKYLIHNPLWGFYRQPVFQDKLPVLQKCIGDNYQLSVQYGQYWIYEKKGIN